MKNIPIYIYPWSYANEQGEADQYKLSQKTNVACKKAIEAVIQQYYHGCTMDSAAAAAQVIKEFGLDRVAYVLANTVREKEWDGRFSMENKRWERSIPVFREADRFGSCANLHFIANSHPGLTNLLVDAVRKLHQQAKNYK